MGIGKKIKQRREALNLTQGELAALVGVTQSAITNYESELSHPKELILYKLFEALDCDANFLFADALKSKTPPPLTAEETKLINTYRNLNSDGQKKLIEHAVMMNASGLYDKAPNAPVVIAARNGKPPKNVPADPDELDDAPDTI